MKIKVLFLITTLLGGGAEKVLSTIVKNLDKDKYDITVMTIDDVGIYTNEIKENARYKSCFKRLERGKNIFEKLYNYVQINYIRKFLEDNPKLFYKIFIKDKYDIEISFLENKCSKIIASSPNKNSRKYLWIHIDLEKYNWVVGQFKNLQEQKEYYSRYCKIFCVSNSVKKSFDNIFNLNNKTYVQYNPNDEKEIVEKSKEIRELEMKSDKFKFITVGRLVEQKGYDRLLEAHRRLINEGFDYELWIVGSGGEYDKYNDFIKKNNLTNNTILTGFQNNPYKYMFMADAYICSSRAEGYSTVVTEALILQLPIISTLCSGATELLHNGEYGLLVNNDIEGVYNGMKKFLIDDKIYKYYKDKAIERSKDFKLLNTMRQIEEILDNKC